MSEGRKMTARIPVTPEIHQAYKDMSHAAGVTFDDLLRFLASENGISIESREDTLGWGLKMRDRLDTWKQQEDKQ